MAMTNELLSAAGMAELLKVSDGFAELVDKYVMAVTEGLCSLENQNRSVMERSDLVEHRNRIMEDLDALDGLMAGFRDTVALASALSSGLPRRHGA